MEYRKYGEGYVLRLDPGDEVVDCLTRLAKEEEVGLVCITGLGAAKDVTVGLFLVEVKIFFGMRCEG